MRKITLLFIALFMVFLAACGDSEEAQDVYQKAVEAGEKLESAEMDMKISQTMEGAPEMGEMVMDMDMQASIVMDPLAMHQKGTMNIEIDGMPVTSESEMYMVEDGIYMFDSANQAWLKMDASMAEELSGMDQDPTEQLAMLESFMDDVEFSEEDGQYIFKFSGEGDELIEFTQQYVEEYLGTGIFAEAGADMNEILDSMTIHSIDYEIRIDNKTYDTKSVISNLDFEIAVDEEGNTMRMNQEMNAAYTGINTVDSIEVPQEVIDAAQDM